MGEGPAVSASEGLRLGRLWDSETLLWRIFLLCGLLRLFFLLLLPQFAGARLFESFLLGLRRSWRGSHGLPAEGSTFANHHAPHLSFFIRSHDDEVDPRTGEQCREDFAGPSRPQPRHDRLGSDFRSELDFSSSFAANQFQDPSQVRIVGGDGQFALLKFNCGHARGIGVGRRRSGRHDQRWVRPLHRHCGCHACSRNLLYSAGGRGRLSYGKDAARK